MIINPSLKLLAGGHYRCTSHWNKKGTKIDQCRKFYFPISGNASVVLKGEEIKLNPSNSYYFSGFQLESQSCTDAMELYWVHFQPESPLVESMLNLAPNHVLFPDQDYPALKKATHPLSSLFKPFENNILGENLLRPGSSTASFLQIEGLLIQLLGTILQHIDPTDIEKEMVGYSKLEGSIHFMKEQYLTNPCLEEIALHSGLTPNYFHQLFARHFKRTPYQFMLDLRMKQAMFLLNTTLMTVYEIAGATGYNDEFHFSKVFKKQTGLSPSNYRKQQKDGETLP